MEKWKHYGKGGSHYVDWIQLDKLQDLVKRLNRAADHLQHLPSSVRGDHWMGHIASQKCYAKSGSLLDTKMEDGKPFKDWLFGQSWDLRYSGYHFFYYGYPLPHIMLARVDSTPYGIMVLEMVTGSERAFRKFHPVSSSLLADNTQRILVDGRDLKDKLSKWTQDNLRERWRVYRCYDRFVQVEHHKHYLFEKNNFFELGLLAQGMGLSSVLQALRLKIFADFLHVPPAERRFSVDPESTSVAQSFAFEGDVPESLLGKDFWSVTPEGHQEIAVLAQEVEDPMREMLEAGTQEGWHIAPRSKQGALLSGMSRDGNLTPTQEFVGLDRCAQDVVEEIHRVLEKNMRPSVRERGKVYAWCVDFADLDAQSPTRQIKAAAQIQTEIFPAYLADSGLAGLYELNFKNMPDCPMPHKGTLPLAIRMRASIFAKVFSDLKKGVKLPDHLFTFSPLGGMTEAQNKAYAGIHAKIHNWSNHLLGIVQLLDGVPLLTKAYDDWATFFEMTHKYMGHGVDSVSELLFPLFFFSEESFERCLEGEALSYRQTWLDIRQIINSLVDDLKKRRWEEVKKKLNGMFAKFLELHLTVVDGIRIGEDGGDGPVIGCPIGPAPLPPFEPPPGTIHVDTMAVDDAQCPIEITKMPPGDPTAYAFLVRRNRRFIKQLRRITAKPMKNLARLRRHAKSGPMFDSRRLPLYEMGHCLYATVDYGLQPVLMRKRQIWILFDFSGSMNAQRVSLGKQVAVILAEGLKDHFHLKFYTYNNDDSRFFRMTTVYDSKDRSICGHSALASICREGMDSGRGGNPDAATLLAVKKLIGREGDGDSHIVIHLSDHEWCSSLNHPQHRGAQEEMAYAVQKLTLDGHHYIAMRVGPDKDPFLNSGLRYEYIHFDEFLTEAKLSEVYLAIKRAACSGPAGGLGSTGKRVSNVA